MAEILHFEILRKHGQTNTHTNKHTNRHGHYNTSPSPYGGRGNNPAISHGVTIIFNKKYPRLKVYDMSMICEISDILALNGEIFYNITHMVISNIAAKVRRGFCLFVGV